MSPWAPLPGCPEPGCPERVQRGAKRCAAHQPAFAAREQARRAAYDALRGTTTERGYGHAWRVLRDAVLQRDPVCPVDGCDAPSEQVDHVIPRAQGGPASLENCRGICAFHHPRKTARESTFGRWRVGRS
jgi:5-methylcytosine-specific restriction protein A